jgi:hypothetical protein
MANFAPNCIMDRYLARLYLRIDPLTWAFDRLKSHGLRDTLSSIVRAFVDVGFDIRYGTETARWVDINTLSVESEHKKDALAYIPTQICPRHFHALGAAVMLEYARAKG